jgi:hypothetical protein
MNSKGKKFLKENSNSKYSLDTKPTAEQRGELIVRRLEKLIREGNANKSGVSFKRWQEIAMQEFTNAILDSDRYKKADNQFLTRVILIAALAIITIGFWGAVVATGVSYDRQIVAFIFVCAGSILLVSIGLWGLRQIGGRFIVARREQRLKRINNFDQQLAKLEIELKKKLKTNNLTK